MRSSSVVIGQLCHATQPVGRESETRAGTGSSATRMANRAYPSPSYATRSTQWYDADFANSGASEASQPVTLHETRGWRRGPAPGARRASTHRSNGSVGRRGSRLLASVLFAKVISSSSVGVEPAGAPPPGSASVSPMARTASPRVDVVTGPHCCPEVAQLQGDGRAHAPGIRRPSSVVYQKAPGAETPKSVTCL